MAASTHRERLKVVVRKLPPLLEETVFKAAVDQQFEERYSWFSFVRGKVSQTKVVSARAYIQLKTQQDVIDFKLAFDGQAFVTDKGAQYRCSVEYAPFQKVPPPKVKRDPKEGTIDKDPDYIAFLARLEAGPDTVFVNIDEAAGPADDNPARPDGGVHVTEDGIKVTPLMLFLQEKHAQARAARRSSGGAHRIKAEPRHQKASKLRSDEAQDTSIMSRRVARDSSAPARTLLADEIAKPLKSARPARPRPAAAPSPLAAPTAPRDAETAIQPAPNSARPRGRDARPADKPQISVLRKPAPETAVKSQPAADPEKPSLQATEPAAAGIADMQKNEAPARETRPVRVRAGFGVFQPRRLGRLLEEPSAASPAAEPAASPASQGAPPLAGGASRSEGSHGDSASPLAPARRSRQARRTRSGHARGGVAADEGPPEQPVGGSMAGSALEGRVIAANISRKELTVAESVASVRQGQQAGTAGRGGTEQVAGQEDATSRNGMGNKQHSGPAGASNTPTSTPEFSTPASGKGPEQQDKEKRRRTRGGAGRSLAGKGSKGQEAYPT